MPHDGKGEFKVYATIDFTLLGPQNFDTDLLIFVANQLLKIWRVSMIWICVLCWLQEEESTTYQAKVHETEEIKNVETEETYQEEDQLEVNKSILKRGNEKPAKSKIALLTMLPSAMYSTFSSEDKQAWAKLSPKGRAMIIKNIAAANKTNSEEEHISASHKCIEINKHEKSPTVAMIDERNISPGQLERTTAPYCTSTTTTHNND